MSNKYFMEKMDFRRYFRKCLTFVLCTIHFKDIAWFSPIFILISIPGMSLCQQHHSTEFMDIQFNFTYTAGDLATLYCRVKDLGTKVVVWRRTSQPNPISVGLDIYVPDDRYHVQHIPYRGSWNLMIKNVNINDAGVYECQISAKERAGSRRLVLLNVLEAPSTTTQKTFSPPDIYITTSSNFVEVGRTITVICNATAIDFPTGDIDWFIEGHKVRENSRTTITKYSSFVEKVIISKLTITNAQLEDAGTYVCRTSESQISNTKIHVLSARSINSKRGTDSEDRFAKSQRSSASSLFTSLPGLLYVLPCVIIHYCRT
ncbi:hemicentin-1-like [Saccostrea echinata]|uniref:hemicentin-1-like n=1 Tax=Saccostrea echinata TaxID=191078 RepID=UPI002A81813F|nr:hemicentin-1-like [Saccostrea echinata]